VVDLNKILNREFNVMLRNLSKYILQSDDETIISTLIGQAVALRLTSKALKVRLDSQKLESPLNEFVINALDQAGFDIIEELQQSGVEVITQDIYGAILRAVESACDELQFRDGMDL